MREWIKTESKNCHSSPSHPVHTEAIKMMKSTWCRWKVKLQSLPNIFRTNKSRYTNWEQLFNSLSLSRNLDLVVLAVRLVATFKLIPSCFRQNLQQVSLKIMPEGSWILRKISRLSSEMRLKEWLKLLSNQLTLYNVLLMTKTNNWEESRKLLTI